jgi:hypothetical protein
MNEFTKITVLEDDKQMKAIFGKELKPFTKSNPFAYRPSAGYYDKNLVKFNVGFVFNTPSGRESKAYPYLAIKIVEDALSGESEWVSDNNTPKKIREKIQIALQDHTLENYFRGYRLKKNYDRGIKYLVVSHGSGGIPCYKLELDEL